MWENETVVLLSSLKSRLLGGGSKIQFEKIAKDKGVPLFIKNLFEKRVDDMMKTDPPITIKVSRHFEISPEEIETLQTRLLDAFRSKAVFNDKDIETILRDALIIRLDYLVKPVDTMRRQIFNGRDRVNLDEIRNALTPFRNILPYADQFMGLCESEKKSDVSTEVFGSIADAVLVKSIGSDPVSAVIRDFSVLSKFMSETRGEEVQRVDGQILQQFLGDRNLWGFRRAIEVEMKLGRKEFELSDLEMTLKRYQELKKEFSLEEALTAESDHGNGAEPKPATQAETVQQQDDEWALNEFLGIEESGTQDSVIEGSVADQSIEEQSVNEEPVPEISLPEASVAEDDRPEGGMSEEPEKLTAGKDESKITVDEAEESGGGEEPDDVDDLLSHEKIVSGKSGKLEDFIDEKTKKVFIKKLFGGEEGAYNKLLNKLNDADSWRVAKILIDNELFKHDVDPFSREAIKLVDMVYSRFYPEEGVGGNQ